MRSVARRLRGLVEDWPGAVTLSLALLVVVHWSLTVWKDGFPDPFGSLATESNVTDLYLGALGFSSLLAGFAGIVVVFAMSPESESLKRLRQLGSARLAANWVAPVTSSVLSAVGASVATALSLSGKTELSGWVFEFTVLAVLHGALRMIWLLRSLVTIVSREDGVKKPAPKVDLSTIPAVVASEAAEADRPE